MKVGAVSVIDTAMAKVFPSIADKMAKMQMGRQQRNEVPRSRQGALYLPSQDGRVRGRGNQNPADSKEAMQSNTRAG